MVGRVARGKLVREEIEAELKKKVVKGRLCPSKPRPVATKELAADQRYSMIRLFEIILTRLWKAFRWCRIQNIENVEILRKDFEIVYVPTHRVISVLLTSCDLSEWNASPHIALESTSTGLSVISYEGPELSLSVVPSAEIDSIRRLSMITFTTC